MADMKKIYDDLIIINLYCLSKISKKKVYLGFFVKYFRHFLGKPPVGPVKVHKFNYAEQYVHTTFCQPFCCKKTPCP